MDFAENAEVLAYVAPYCHGHRITLPNDWRLGVESVRIFFSKELDAIILAKDPETVSEVVWAAACEVKVNSYGQFTIPMNFLWLMGHPRRFRHAILKNGCLSLRWERDAG
jgi:hypothetical protein